MPAFILAITIKIWQILYVHGGGGGGGSGGGGGGGGEGLTVISRSCSRGRAVASDCPPSSLL